MMPLNVLKEVNIISGSLSFHLKKGIKSQKIKQMNFHTLKNNEIVFQPQDIQTSSKYLDPGIYLLMDKGGMMNTKITLLPLDASNLISFSDGIIKDFLIEADQFFTERTTNIYKDLKIKHSTGYIVYGKPGTGKTCLCLLAMSELAKKYNAICIDTTKTGIHLAKQMIAYIREIQTNPIILFLDECDNQMCQYEHAFLPLLDGNETIQDFIFLGCTNNLEKISDRIKNRKSRIKKCFEIKSLPKKIYEEYLQERLPGLDKPLFSEICYKAMDKGLTIDQFKNALLDYCLRGNGIDNAMEEVLETYNDSIVEKDDD